MYDIGIIITDENGIVFKDIDYLYLNMTAEDILYIYDYLDYLNVGRYSITVINLKDGTNDTSEFEIYPIEIPFESYEMNDLFDIIIDFWIGYSEYSDLTITLNDKTKTIKIGNFYEFKDDGDDDENEGDDYEIIFKNCKPGKYELNIYHSGNENYYPLFYTKIFEMEKWIHHYMLNLMLKETN